MVNNEIVQEFEGRVFKLELDVSFVVWFVVSVLTVYVMCDFNFIPVFWALMRRNENEVESGMDVETRLNFYLWIKNMHLMPILAKIAERIIAKSVMLNLQLYAFGPNQ